MQEIHAARPRLVVDNSGCIALCLSKGSKKLKGDFGMLSLCGPLDQDLPKAGRNAVSRPHGTDVTVAGSDVVAEGPGRRPRVDNFLESLHEDGTIQNVAPLVNTKRSAHSNTMRSAMEETPASRLKIYRKLADHETAESFAQRHAGIAGSTQRSREAGTRPITAKVAEKYAKLFKHYKKTRHVTAALLLYGGAENQIVDDPPIHSSIRTEYDALLDPLTDEELKRAWAAVAESIKLVKKTG